MLVLVPDLKNWSGLDFRPVGAFQFYSMGNLTLEQAWAFGEHRATGRHILQLIAGEEVDVDLFVSAFDKPPKTSTRIGKSIQIS